MDLVIGYVGMACSGKDTASKAVLQPLFEQSSEVVLEVEDKENAVKGKAGVLHGKSIVVWHVPLALGVKLEFVEEQAKLGIDIDLQRLLYDGPYKCKFREDLIRIGDGNRNNIHPLYWIHKVQKIIEHLRETYKQYDVHVFQITDMRYENEAPEFEAYCYDNNMSMLSIKMSVRLATLLSRMPAEDVAIFMQRHRNNKSERNVKRVHADIELDNNGDIFALGMQIRATVLPVLNTILLGSPDTPHG